MDVACGKSTGASTFITCVERCRSSAHGHADHHQSLGAVYHRKLAAHLGRSPESLEPWLAEHNVPESQDMHAEMLKRLELQAAKV